MMQAGQKKDIFQKLQKEILSLQGFRAPSESQRVAFGLGVIENAFPNQQFPTSAIHEFISSGKERAAATNGYIAALLGRMMQRGGLCLWISQKRTIFPPALKFFGIDPGRVIFIDVKNDRDLLWMVEESLKCPALCAVAAEIQQINLTESRRLQLAVEQSGVTGLLHCVNPRIVSNTACHARWKITPVASTLEEDMPGMGFFSWDVELLKVRNGEPGRWQLQWISGTFKNIRNPAEVTASHNLLKTG